MCPIKTYTAKKCTLCMQTQTETNLYTHIKSVLVQPLPVANKHLTVHNTLPTTKNHIYLQTTTCPNIMSHEHFMFHTCTNPHAVRKTEDMNETHVNITYQRRLIQDTDPIT